MPSGRKRACSLPFLETRRLCQMRDRDHPPHLSQPPHPPFVCRVCHFSSLDNSGLLQHLSVSQHCSMLGSMCINDLGDNDDSNNNVLLDIDDDSSMGSSAHGYTSDGPDFSTMIRTTSLHHLMTQLMFFLLICVAGSVHPYMRMMKSCNGGRRPILAGIVSLQMPLHTGLYFLV